jgi:hypothetical protein
VSVLARRFGHPIAFLLLLSDVPTPRALPRVGISRFRLASGEDGSTALGDELARSLAAELRGRGLDPVTVGPSSSTLAAAARMGRDARAELLLLGTVVEASTSSSRSYAEGAPKDAVVDSFSRVRLRLHIVDCATARVRSVLEAEAIELGDGDGGAPPPPGRPGWDESAIGRAARLAVQRLAGKLAASR